MSRRRAVLALLGTGLLVLAGCGDGGEDGTDDGSGGRTGPVLPVGDVDLDVAAPAYSTGREIRVGEVTVPVDPAPDSWVIGPHGVYYLTDETLWFAGEDGSEQVAVVGRTALEIAPDRSLLGFVDLVSGPPDRYGTPIAVPVVLDLETGEEVLRGDPADASEDDLADLYSEVEPVVLGFDDDAVYAVDPLRGGLNRFPLDGGDPVELTDAEEEGLPDRLEDAAPGREVGLVSLPGGRLRVAEGPDEPATDRGRLSPDGRWVAVAGVEEPVVVHDTPAGRPTRLADGLVRFGGWLDDGSFSGLVVPAGGRAPEVVDGPYRPELLRPWDAQVVVCRVDGSGCPPTGEAFTLPHPLADDAVTVFPQP